MRVMRNVKKEFVGSEMENVENSKFSRLIQVAFKENFDPQFIQDAYSLLESEVISDNLELLWKDSPELMESGIRFLVQADILTRKFQQTIPVKNCPPENRDSFSWYVKLFGYLESEVSNWEVNDNADFIFTPSKDCERTFQDGRITLDLDVSKMRFLYFNVVVKFLDSEN